VPSATIFGGVDLSRPISTAIPSLDGPVLQVLAAADRELSGRQIHSLAGSGSVAGVRLVLQRLATTGLVHVHESGNSLLYSLNRKHLAAQAVEMLADLRTTFAANLAAEFATWTIAPLHASLFGAIARAEGDLDSDVDVLLVRPDEVAPDNLLWVEQTTRLLEAIVAQTGNPANLYDLTHTELTTATPTPQTWPDPTIPLTGPPLAALLRSRPRALAKTS
jgi:predicted nucleotidyltransferase